MSTRNSVAVEQWYRAANADLPIIERLAIVERHLWGLLAVSVLADVVLTAYGLEVGLREGNPAMRMAIDTAGIAALVGVKLLIVGFGAGVRRVMDERGAVVPLGLTIPWFVAASINAAHLL